MRFLATFLLFLFLVTSANSQKLKLENVAPQNDASFRGLSVVDDDVAWVSGSKGWVGRTTDGGRNWTFSQVPAFEKMDFRTIYAFNDQKAVIANAGSPANILLTTDGGKTWKAVYTNSDTSAFIDGGDFFNETEGILYGDPIGGKMLLIATTDGGATWKDFPEHARPILNDGEASFAASGTNIRCSGNREVTIATGGKTSRLWLSMDRGLTWRTIPTPMIQGESSTGIFSLARKNNHVIIVGGDYLKEAQSVNHVFYTTDKGVIWHAPAQPTRGYRESVEFITDRLVIAAGPSGIDVSSDAGKSWRPFSDEKYFHVVRRARKGRLVLIAGGKGKIAILKI